MDDEQAETAPLIYVDGAGLRGIRGWAFRGARFRLDAGDVAALTGPSGSGRSTLLLAIAGRLHLTHGALTVGGHTLTPDPSWREVRDVRKQVAIARIGHIIGLDSELTLNRNLRDAADWANIPVESALDHMALWRANFDLPFPGEAPLNALDDLEQLIAHLLLATFTGPRAIVIDDVDANLTDGQLAQAWHIIGRLARGELRTPPMAVVASTVREAQAVADVVVPLDPHEHETPSHREA